MLVLSAENCCNVVFMCAALVEKIFMFSFFLFLKHLRTFDLVLLNVRLRGEQIGPSSRAVFSPPYLIVFTCLCKGKNSLQFEIKTYFCIADVNRNLLGCFFLVFVFCIS